MKINWGTGLAIGMVAFISFIMYFVVTMLTNKEFEHDLVTEEYYKAELHFQQDIDAEENANALPENIQSERTKDGYLLKFPESLVISGVKGNVYMYRPSNEKLDFNIPFVLAGTDLLIPDEKMIGGRWNIHVTWEHLGKEYLYKTEILY
ncbi:FixH family protein [Salegentibacter sp. F188]|uniref:FixH family protein n=1 Tax=Autumnicola patrickiae TaxID=3075591 RepID=A0ABU3E3P8_9FLAO|nr:FixH family protein [Salegentibacter sp. F188]MDT0690622.1 FixH family protein [Salegentibacter sp. F188]